MLAILLESAAYPGMPQASAQVIEQHSDRQDFFYAGPIQNK